MIRRLHSCLILCLLALGNPAFAWPGLGQGLARKPISSGAALKKPAPASWSPEASAVIRDKARSIGGQHYLHIKTFGSGYNLTDHQHIAKDSIIVIFNSSYHGSGHTEVVVGGKRFDMLGSRNSTNEVFGRSSDLLDGMIGAVYKVPREEIKPAQEYFEALSTTINKHNFPPFKYAGGSSLLKPTARADQWEIVVGPNSKRSVKNRLVQATLIQEGGQHYLQAPPVTVGGKTLEPIRLPVTKTDQGLRLEGRSCATFVTTTLNQLAQQHEGLVGSFTTTAAARSVGSGIAQGLLSRERKPDLILHYSVEDAPGDLEQAVQKIVHSNR